MSVDMTSFLKEGVKGEHAIEYFKIAKEDLDLLKIRDAINGRGEYTLQEPGTFVRLKHKGEIVMSNTWMEQDTNRPFIYHANGDVLIAGLGIGLVLVSVQDKDVVKSITVIEKYQDVIDLVTSQLPLNDKVKVVCADIFEWKPEKGTKYDTIYFDIWNNNCSDNYKDMCKLHKAFGRYRNKENSKSWMSSWDHYVCKRLHMENKRFESRYY